MKLAKTALMVSMILAGLTSWAARYFIADGGDISDTAHNYYIPSGNANFYLSGGYNKGGQVDPVWTGYLRDGKTLTVGSNVFYVFSGFTLYIEDGILDCCMDSTGTTSNFSIGKGTVNQSGGIVNVSVANSTNFYGQLCVAYDDNGPAIYNLSGGELNICGSSMLLVRKKGAGVFNQTGGVLDTSGGKEQAIVLGFGGSGTATLNLKGGVAKVGRFYSNITTASYLNFDGGTVQPLAASTEFIGATAGSKGLTAKVLAGGAIIDTAYDVTSCLPLLSGAATDGGLTKKGEGVLTLASGNTYNGPTKIEKGALKIVKGQTLAGSLSIAKDAQLVISGVMDTDIDQVVATFNGGITLANGVVAQNAFASDVDFGRTFELSGDGKSIIAKAVTANLFPLSSDWNRRYFDYAVFDGLSEINLNGHDLAVRLAGNLAATGMSFTDTASAGGKLFLNVPAGMVITNKNVALSGSLALHKVGAGTYSSQKANQTHTGGTVIADGEWRTDLKNITTFGEVTTGSDKRVIRIETGATLELNGVSFDYATAQVVLAGGCLANSGASIGNSFGTEGETGGAQQFVHVKLEADSRIEGNNIPILAGSYTATDLDLGGHTLTVAMNESRYLYLCNTTVTGGGCIEVTSGYLVIGGYRGGGEAKGTNISMPTTSLIQSGTGGVRLQKNLEVLDYTCTATSTWTPKAGTLTVNGSLCLATDKFVKTVLKAGGKIDVSAMTTPCLTTSAIDNQGSVTLPASVAVIAGDRQLHNGDKLIDWTPNAYASTTFTADATMTAHQQMIEKRADGLYAIDLTVPYYATRDVSNNQWQFFDYTGSPFSNWEGGVTSEIWVRFSTDEEYQAIKTLGVTGRGLVLTAGALPVNAEPVVYDWSELDFKMLSGATFDLKGNTLKVPTGLLAATYTTQNFVSTVAGGVVTFEAASGTTTTNTSTSLGSGVTFIKSGAGALVWAHNDPAANCTVVAGTLLGGVNDGLFSAITVEKGATFDFNGSYNHTSMKIVSNGGTLTNAEGINNANTVFSELVINDDTLIESVGGSNSKGWGMRGGKNQVTLNGKKLTINIGLGRCFWFAGTKFVDAGTVEYVRGGYLYLQNDSEGNVIEASQVTFIHTYLDTSAEHVGGSFRHDGDVNVGNYFVDCQETSSYGSATFNVNGTFRAEEVNGANYFMNVKMLNGSTLDLSTRTNALTSTGTVSRYLTRHLTFADGATVTVDVHGRELSKNAPTRVVTWSQDEMPENVKFKLDSQTDSRYSVRATADGLDVYYVGSMMIFLR